MAYIYAADIFCNDCGEDIKRRIARELWEYGEMAVLPDGQIMMLTPEVTTFEELEDYLEDMDERTYDSDDYPKYGSDDSESDCPEHCGSHRDCINYGELADGFRYGCLISTNLTTDGVEYVKEAVREGDDGGVAREVWAVEFDWIDFDEGEEDDDYDD